eukprot:213943-Rhodomonas_salina.1
MGLDGIVSTVPSTVCQYSAPRSTRCQYNACHGVSVQNLSRYISTAWHGVSVQSLSRYISTVHRCARHANTMPITVYHCTAYHVCQYVASLSAVTTCQYSTYHGMSAQSLSRYVRTMPSTVCQCTACHGMSVPYIASAHGKPGGSTARSANSLTAWGERKG